MSVGLPIDVTRLLGDNHRFQRELSQSRLLQQQLRAQLDHALAANSALRAQADTLHATRQQQFDSFVASHQQLYRTEVAALKEEREELLRRVQGGEAGRQSDELAVEELRREIETHEAGKRGLERDLEMVRGMMAGQMAELQAALNTEREENGLKISEMEAANAALRETEEGLREDLTRAETDRARFEQENITLRQNLKRLEQNWSSVVDKTPAGLLSELMQLRKESLALKREAGEQQLGCLTTDEAVYSLVKKLHEELAVARYELVEARNAVSEVELGFENERAQARNLRAQQELTVMKLQREVAVAAEQEREGRARLERAEERARATAEAAVDREKAEEEMALLRIKVFVLESLRGAEDPKRRERDYSRYEAELSTSAFKLKGSRMEVVRSVGEIQAALGDAVERLREEEGKRRELGRKSREYKAKWEAVARREEEAVRGLTRLREKEGEYQRLIERMQQELEKAYLSSQGDSSGQTHPLVVSYQQKLAMAAQETAHLRGQLSECEERFFRERRQQEKEATRLTVQLRQMEENYGLALQKTRSLENRLLEQSLSAAGSKVARNYQAELAEKTAALAVGEEELQGLREQLQAERENALQLAASVSRLEAEVARLSGQLSTPAFQAELGYLQQKLAYVQGVLGEQRQAANALNDSHIRTLYDQLARLKTETQETRHDSALGHAQGEIDSYRQRLLELQEALRGISGQNEEKSLQIFRLNEENNLLSKQLDKIEEELDVLRGKAGSMKELDLIDRNKQLEEELASLRRELGRAAGEAEARGAELEGLRRECEDYWADNLKLLVVIKENNLQLKENRFLTEKYDLEVAHRAQQQDARLLSLTNENEILRNLVEDLRKSMLERQAERERESGCVRGDLEAARRELEAKERENFYFQEELNRLLEERTREKGAFDEEWNKLVDELAELRRQLGDQQISHPKGEEAREAREASGRKGEGKEEPGEEARSEPLDETSRIKLLLSQQGEEIAQLNLRSLAAELEAEVARKNERIEQLQSELGDLRFSLSRSGVFSREVVELRDQLQALMATRFQLEDRLRVLEQENSLLKIRRINEVVEKVDPEPPAFSQQTFGPSLGTTQLIEQLRDSEQPEQGPSVVGVSAGELRSWNDRYEEVLCTLVVSFAENESLRAMNAELKERGTRQWLEYGERLREVEASLNARFEPEPDVGLLREVESRGLLAAAGREEVCGLAQLGSFTESITGGKMIESYSVQEEEPVSQDTIHL